MCEADEVAHSLMRKGELLFERVLAHFGPRVLNEAGEIDRGALGAIVFQDEAERLTLNSLVHPGVERELRDWVEARRNTACLAAAVIVPLLFESGMAGGWDAIVCVSASESVQVRRLIDRRLTEAEASQRIAAQWPVERKAECADFVLVNNGTEELLMVQTKRMLKHILQMEMR